MRKRLPKLWLKQITPWIVPILLIMFWQLLVQFGLLQARVLPAPTAVIQAAIALASSGELLRHTIASSTRAIVGLLIGGGIGFVLGLLNGVFPIAEKLLDSSMQMLRNIPHLAMIPLVIVWFGIGEEAKIFLVAVGVMFPIYLNTYHGIHTVDKGLLEMGRIYGLNPWEQFWQIILPGAMPSILIGLRYALGIMWLTLIVAETIAADSGIGYMAMNAREFMQTDVIVFSILVYALLGKLADTSAKVLEEELLRWHPSYQIA
jgi:sulfonate transport system permease protein